MLFLIAFIFLFIFLYFYFKPNHLKPFSVKIRNERRSNFAGVSFIRNIEIEIEGKLYILNKFDNKNFIVADGFATNMSFTDKIAEISLPSNRLKFVSASGLYIVWDGYERIDVLMCEAYNNFVCGLCGNSNGWAGDDFSDRNNNQITIDANGDINNRFLQYANQWITTDSKNDAPA